MSEIQYVSKEGLEKLKQDLHFIKYVERPRITNAIAEARDKGDLSENAEYDAAKEEQGQLEFKISQLEHTLANARVIDNSMIDTSRVSIMCKVKVKNHNVGNVAEYRLVSETEANLKESKISIKSAIAQGLMGKIVGDVVNISVPAGVVKLEILEIGL
ncbi:MAG: transcription elongation factor GreA [Flavobacteriales bacterium]|nr:transcription elongation factor GreA [Flavobacteriaceae bacterium]PHX93224.1 MAG: transcription elongation factor GreA [Flavobacteriales bacterium]